jgi:Low affinity iron permease
VNDNPPMGGFAAADAAGMALRHGLRLADYIIMAIVTEKEKVKQREESRDFFCLVSDAFRICARRSSMVLGSAWAFAIAVLIIVIWALTGPMFHYSNTWQLIKYRDDDCYFPDGLSHSEYTESRCQSSSFETRRNNSSAERR